MPLITVEDALQPVAQMCADCPSPTLIRAYVDAARTFCFRTRMREREMEVTCTINEPRILLDDSDTENVMGIYAAVIDPLDGGRPKPLTENASGDWDRSAASDVPEFYQYIYPNYMGVHRAPNQAYPITVTAVMRPKQTATQLDAALVEQYGWALEHGALYYLLRLPNEKWTDKTMAVNHHFPAFEDAIRSAAMRHSRRNNPGAQITDRLGRPNAAARSRMQPI